MSYIKFNLVLITLLLSSIVHASFLDCLNLEYETTVNRKVLFGLLENQLTIKKNKCIIEISLTEYKYLNSNWLIDTCREPIHIKKGATSVDVLKRVGSCAQNTNDFCKEWQKLKLVIQDHGLIFATGEREKLEDQHGQIYCSYQLLDKYLAKGNVLSRYKVEAKSEPEVSNDLKIEENTKSSTVKDTSSHESNDRGTF